MNGRSLVILLTAGHCLAMVDRFLLAVAAPDVGRALQLGDGMLGFALGTGFALAYAVAAVPLGRLADRGWRRALLIGGVGLWSAASLATGLCTTVTQLIAARMTMGLGQSAFIPAALATLLDAPEATRAGRLSLFTAGSTLGRSVAMLGGGFILARLAKIGWSAQWRLLFVLTSLPNLLLAIALVWRGDLGGETAPAQRVEAARAAEPVLLGCYLLAAVAPIIVGQATASWLPSLLTRTQAMRPADAGLLAGAVALVTAPAGQLLGGWCARRWSGLSQRPTLVVAAGLWATLPALLLVTVATGSWATAVGIGMINVILGVASFTAIFGWQQLMPADMRGLGNGGFLAFITLVGIGAGPLTTGVLSQSGGGGGRALGDALLLTAFGAAALASVAAAGLALAGKRPSPDRPSVA